MKPHKLAKALVGRTIPIQVYGCQVLESHNCLIVDDLILVPYGTAQAMINRDRAHRTFTRVLQNRLVRWCVIKLYNMFLYSSGQHDLMLVPAKENDDGQADEAAPEPSNSIRSSTGDTPLPETDGTVD